MAKNPSARMPDTKLATYGKQQLAQASRALPLLSRGRLLTRPILQRRTDEAYDTDLWAIPDGPPQVFTRSRPVASIASSSPNKRRKLNSASMDVTRIEHTHFPDTNQQSAALAVVTSGSRQLSGTQARKPASGSLGSHQWPEKSKSASSGEIIGASASNASDIQQTKTAWSTRHRDPRLTDRLTPTVSSVNSSTEPSKEAAMSSYSETQSVMPPKIPSPSPQPSCTYHTKRTRKRIIDALADQQADRLNMDCIFSSPVKKLLRSESAPVSGSEPATTTPVTFPKALSFLKPAPKFIYGDERTILADSRLADDTTATGPLPHPISVGSEKSSPGSECDAAVSCSRGTVQSVHELRKSGANDRSVNEIDDLMERIGTRSQHDILTCRNALLELAQKLQQKDFMRRFYSCAATNKSPWNIADKDFVSCFSILAVAVISMTSSCCPPSLIASLLQASRPECLLTRLVQMDEDVCQLASRKRPRLALHSRKSLLDIKTFLLTLGEWEYAAAEQLSPRTLVLKFLHLAGTLVHANDYVTVLELLMGDLFPILVQTTTSSLALEGELVLAILELYSAQAVQCGRPPHWQESHWPIVAKLLRVAVRGGPSRYGRWETLAFKLALNITNQNPFDPSQDFVQADILHDLATSLNNRFAQLGRTGGGSRNDDQNHAVFGELMMIASLLINIAEKSSDARDRLYQYDSNGTRPTEMIISMFFVKPSIPASNVTHTDLARLYLSVLLGFLLLHQPTRRLLEELRVGTGLSEVLASVKEFMESHQSVVGIGCDKVTSKLEGLANELLEHRS